MSVELFTAKSLSALEGIDRAYRLKTNKVKRKYSWEYGVNNTGTSYREIFGAVAKKWSKDIIDDSFSGFLVYLVRAEFPTNYGLEAVISKSEQYFLDIQKGLDGERELLILSIESAVVKDSICCNTLVAVRGFEPDFKGYKGYIDKTSNLSPIQEPAAFTLSKEDLFIVPDDVKNIKLSESELDEYSLKLKAQNEAFKDESMPFLNKLNSYIPQKPKNPIDYAVLKYNLAAVEKSKLKLKGTYESFKKVFNCMVDFAGQTERNAYIGLINDTLNIRGETADKEINKKIKVYMDNLEKHLTKEYVRSDFDKSDVCIPQEDVPQMMDRLHKALFQLYIIQDLIDDPDITDIKITSWDCIRCRIRGKAYLTNVTFASEADYRRFVEALAIKNRIDDHFPNQFFTDKHDKNYNLRITLIAPYITFNNQPNLVISKVSLIKKDTDRLIEDGMMTPVVRDYIVDKVGHGSALIVGGPRSGKTTLLNALLEEAYEQSTEIMVIQDHAEVFANRPGVIVENTVGDSVVGFKPVNLEELAQKALVSDVNVFVIGETKGAEMCYICDLANSDCRTITTLHANSEEEAIDKAAGFCLRGVAKTHDQAMRMLLPFKIIIFLKEYKIEKISEIVCYNENTERMVLRPIYIRSYPRKEV